MYQYTKDDFEKLMTNLSNHKTQTCLFKYYSEISSVELLQMTYLTRKFLELLYEAQLNEVM
jgi:hypothetical protein